MAGIFESVTRAAIDEIIEQHTKKSKFGFVLSAEGCEGLKDDIYSLIMTSRRLKDAGDKMMQGPSTPRRSPTISPRLIR